MEAKWHLINVLIITHLLYFVTIGLIEWFILYTVYRGDLSTHWAFSLAVK